jgi:3-hydroxy-9,10-secoandrosta-1,3,5(10)-triene-9,17-dione monooxygenase reductase component
MAQNPKAFRNALGSFATGVTVVTTCSAEGQDVGLTANSFNSVSLDPPMVLWSLNRNSASLPAFTEGRAFAVHVLAASQQALSDRFASRMPDRFAGLELKRGIEGTPLLGSCAACFQCRLSFRYDGGDHEILVGEVVAFESTSLTPLIYHGGAYGDLRQRGTEEAGDDELGPGELLRLLSRAYFDLSAKAVPEFSRRGLTQEAYWVLRMLGYREPQGPDEMAARTAKAGRELTPALLLEMTRRGYIAAEGERFRLTSDGRQTMLELAAIDFASEEEALHGLDRSERGALKRMLRKLPCSGDHAERNAPAPR